MWIDLAHAKGSSDRISRQPKIIENDRLTEAVAAGFNAASHKKPSENPLM